jgi:hypothetical protein
VEVGAKTEDTFVVPADLTIGAGPTVVIPAPTTERTLVVLNQLAVEVGVTDNDALAEALPAGQAVRLVANGTAWTATVLADRPALVSDLPDPVTLPLAISDGGTGATTAKAAVTALTTVVQNANTTIELADSDSGTIIELTGTGAVNITVPSGLATGFNCMVVQQGSGVTTTTFVQGSGATLNSYGGLLKLAGRYAAASVVRLVGASTYNLSGTLA